MPSTSKTLKKNQKSESGLGMTNRGERRADSAPQDQVRDTICQFAGCAVAARAYKIAVLPPLRFEFDVNLFSAARFSQQMWQWFTTSSSRVKKGEGTAVNCGHGEVNPGRTRARRMRPATSSSSRDAKCRRSTVEFCSPTNH